jgi:type IV fimbrial biogenesis protein FimT
MERNMPRNGTGYTLLEFIISLTIIALVTSIAVPSANKLFAFIRGHNASHALRLSLKYARSTAVTRREIVRLCASADGDTCSNSRKWEQGWITYIDRSGKSSRTINDPILQIQLPFENLIIRKNGLGKTVKFNRIGRIGLNRSFSVCTTPDFKPYIRIVMTHSGRLRMDEKNIKCS